MEVSKLTLSPTLRTQCSTKEHILRWMQQNKSKTKHTNITRLSRQIQVPGTNQESIKQAIYLMVKNQMISRFGTKFDSQFNINYLHRDIPKTVLENAPEEEMRLFKDTLQGIKAGKQLTDNGCLTNKKEEKPKEKQEETGQTNIQIIININTKTGELNVQTKS